VGAKGVRRTRQGGYKVVSTFRWTRREAAGGDLTVRGADTLVRKDGGVFGRSRGLRKGSGSAKRGRNPGCNSKRKKKKKNL